MTTDQESWLVNSYHRETHCSMCLGGHSRTSRKNCWSLQYLGLNEYVVIFLFLPEPILLNLDDLIAIGAVLSRLATCENLLYSIGYNALVSFTRCPGRPKFEVSREQQEYFLFYDLQKERVKRVLIKKHWLLFLSCYPRFSQTTVIATELVTSQGTSLCFELKLSVWLI